MNYRKELPQVSFLRISKQPLSHIIFRRLQCQPSLQKSEAKIFKQKIFHNELVQSQREKRLGCCEILRIANNKQMLAV